MNDKEKLFARYFSNAYTFAKSQDITDLEADIRHYEEEIFRCKARLQGMQLAQRERTKE